MRFVSVLIAFGAWACVPVDDPSPSADTAADSDTDRPADSDTDPDLAEVPTDLGPPEPLPVVSTDCNLPTVPTLHTWVASDPLPVTGPEAVYVVLAAEDPLPPPEDPAWQPATASLDLSTQPIGQPLRLALRSTATDCGPDDVYSHTARFAATYPGAVNGPDAQAIDLDDPVVAGWVRAVQAYDPGPGVDEAFSHPSEAFGPATGVPDQVVSLGQGGSLTMALPVPVYNHAGPELAVFENSFSDTFLELATVAVSTDGTTWAAWDTRSQLPMPGFDASDAAPFLERDPTQLLGFAGDLRAGWGTPFDLALLRHHPAVRSGAVDLQDIHFVRVTDVLGDGSVTDSFGTPVYDPFPTQGSAGFDLDAIAVLSAP